jgi:hypothetical protein
MRRLAQMPAIVRLKDLLADADEGGDRRAAARAVMAEATQRLFAGPQWAPRERLELLTDLALRTTTGPLPDRERDLVIAELGRLALRILWSEGLLGDTPNADDAPATIVRRLLELAATDMLPEGPALRVVMKRAKELLQRHDLVAELAANEDLRHRLLDLLDRAQSRRDVLVI